MNYVFSTEVYCAGLNYSLEIELVADVNYYPGCKGSRDEYGQPIEPDDDEEFEVCGITSNQTNPTELQLKVAEHFNELDDYGQLIDQMKNDDEFMCSEWEGAA